MTAGRPRRVPARVGDADQDAAIAAGTSTRSARRPQGISALMMLNLMEPVSDRRTTAFTAPTRCT